MTFLALYLGTLVMPFFASDLHESRLEIWHASFISFSQHPLIGGGFGNIDTLIHAGTKTYASFISAHYVDSAHNIFLDFALQGGLIGLFAFCSLVVTAFVSVFRKKRYMEFTMLLGFLVVLSFNPASVWTLVVFWFLIGQANEIRFVESKT
jgi:O-antigen ligase